MELKDQSIMFFTRTMGLGGTENVVLQYLKKKLKKLLSVPVAVSM